MRLPKCEARQRGRRARQNGEVPEPEPADRALATAHRDWDERWRDERQRDMWQAPDSRVRDVVGELRRRHVRDVLDLGCGIGRHALYLAAEGFNVTGTDASPAGIEEAQSTAERRGLEVSLQVQDFLDLSLPDQSFDYVLAWNVAYHGDRNVAAVVLDGVRRVLRPGGLYQATMLSKRNAAYGVGQEVAPDTYVDPDDQGDKGHPHFYLRLAHPSRTPPRLRGPRSRRRGATSGGLALALAHGTTLGRRL
jgi:tellurite methyltransferase